MDAGLATINNGKGHSNVTRTKDQLLDTTINSLSLADNIPSSNVHYELHSTPQSHNNPNSDQFRGKKMSVTSNSFSNFFKGKNPMGKKGLGVDDTPDDDDIEISDASMITFNDISSLRNNGGPKYSYNSGFDDTSPIIPTILTKDNGNMNNIEYRKHITAQKKMAFNAMAKLQQYGPRAMSLQSYQQRPHETNKFQPLQNQFYGFDQNQKINNNRSNSLLSGAPPRMFGQRQPPTTGFSNKNSQLPPGSRAMSFEHRSPQQRTSLPPQQRFPSQSQPLHKYHSSVDTNNQRTTSFHGQGPLRFPHVNSPQNIKHRNVNSSQPPHIPLHNTLPEQNLYSQDQFPLNGSLEQQNPNYISQSRKTQDSISRTAQLIDNKVVNDRENLLSDNNRIDEVNSHVEQEKTKLSSSMTTTESLNMINGNVHHTIDNNIGSQEKKGKVHSLSSFDSQVNVSSHLKSSKKPTSVYKLENSTDQNVFVTASDLHVNLSTTTHDENLDYHSNQQSLESYNIKQDEVINSPLLEPMSKHQNFQEANVKSKRFSTNSILLKTLSQTHSPSSIEPGKQNRFQSSKEYDTELGWHTDNSSGWNNKRKSYSSLFSKSPSLGASNSDVVVEAAKISDISKKFLITKTEESVLVKDGKPLKDSMTKDDSCAEQGVTNEDASNFKQVLKKEDESNFTAVDNVLKPAVPLQKKDNDYHNFENSSISDDHLELINRNQNLMNEIQIVSKELAESISREISLEKMLVNNGGISLENTGNLSLLDFEIELRKKSSKIVELIQELNNERLKRFTAEKQVFCYEKKVNQAHTGLVQKVSTLEKQLASKDEEIKQLKTLISSHTSKFN